MKNKLEYRDDPNFEIPFWKDWIEADYFERQKLVGKLPILKIIEDSKKLPKEIGNKWIIQLISGYFDDLENAIHINIDLEKNKS